MEPSRIERVLRKRPSNEPDYRAQPLSLVVSSTRRGGRGLGWSIAASAMTAAAIALAGVVAFVFLTPGFGPADDGLPALCSPERLDFRVVRVVRETDVMGGRRIETELENVGLEDCAVPRAMHVRIHDRPNGRVPADSEFTALREGREHLVPGMVRLPSGSVARGVIEWTSFCRPVKTADLSVLAYLSERPPPTGTRLETAYDVDGLAGVPACTRPESGAVVSPLEITPTDTDEWGPLAVTTAAINGDMALTSGVLRISDACVVLETPGDGPTLLVWSRDQVSWDAKGRQILVHGADGGVIEFRDGQQVSFGGSGESLDSGESFPVEGRRLSWDEWVAMIDWAAAPDQSCRAGAYWSVGQVIAEPEPVPTASQGALVPSLGPYPGRPWASTYGTPRRSSRQLWLDPAAEDANVCLVFEERVERWPRAEPMVACG